MLFDFFEGAFGLASEVGRTVFQRVIAYVKWVLKRGAIGLGLSAVCVMLGIQFDFGPLVFIGIAGVGVSTGFTFLALSPAVWLLWVAEEKSEKAQRLAMTAFVIVAGFFIMAIYVVVFRAWHNQEFWVLMPIAIILVMVSVVRGSFIDPKTVTHRAIYIGFVVLLYIVASMAYEKIPEFYRTRVTDSAQTLVGLNSGEVSYESIDKFFSSDGKPRVWYIEYKDQRHFFESPGYDQRRGQARMPITAEVIDQEDATRTQAKLAAEQKIIDEKALVDAETARLKAMEEAERVAREAVQAEERRLANLPVTVVGTILAPTDQSQDIVIIRPSAPFKYHGITIQPDQSVVILDITDVKPASEKNKYELTLQPQTLMSNGQSYYILHQAAPIQLLVKKGNSRNILKILGGALGGAAAGAIAGGKKGAVGGMAIGAVAGTIYAMSSHGKKFQLVVGDPVPPIIISPVL